MIKVQFLKEAQKTDVAIAVGVFDEQVLSDAAAFLDETTGGLLKRTLAVNRFKGKVGDTLSLMAPNDLKVNRIVLLGLGPKNKVTESSLQEAGAHLYRVISATPDQEVVFHAGNLATDAITNAAVCANVAYGALLKSWRFDKYKTKEKPEDKPALKTVTVITEDPQGSEKAFEPLSAVAQGAFWCRMLQSEPANILYPEAYAKWIDTELTPLGVTVEILDVPAMEKLGMGALLGVGQGSENASRLVIMQYNGGPKDQQPVAFIGKGVTFDSGGISIKPAQGMEEMKYDMSGSASVAGLIKALALRKAKVNAIGVVGLVENMPSGNAQRPGDIVTSMSGQTIQVENTDAEGRLVLCDALWYTQERFKPQFMINLATLTGAIVVSLGSVYAGLFSNNDELADRLFQAGQDTGEMLWRLPMHKLYDKQLDLDFCDMNNIGTGREAGSITAAQFLERFVNNVPWAHLDIAGTAWISKREPALCQKGATSIGVRLLDRLVRDHYEAA
jgi:leucyl aminopeptidase